MKIKRAVTKVGFLFGGAAECYVLEDGERVFSQRGIVKALTAKNDGKSGGRDRGDLGDYLGGLPKRFGHLSAAAHSDFTTIDGRTASGRSARWFVDLCNAYVDAALAGELRPNQMHLAGNARRVIAAAATIGLETLIDDACGYQPAESDSRSERFMKELFREDPRKWQRFWPQDIVDEFCRTFRLQRTQSFPAPMLGIIGKLYELRLGREKHEELKRLNPRGPDRDMHHQHFADSLFDLMGGDMGAIRGLLIVARSKDHFWEMWEAYCTGRAQLGLW